MAALAATSSATPSLQSTLLQSRVQQVRREADQAQAYADSLREQADQQDRTVQQARQRAQTLQRQSLAAASESQITSRQPSTQTQAEIKPTYTEVLAGAFQLVKPILNADLSSTQKNVVTGGAFEAATVTWSADQWRTRVIQSYSDPLAAAPGKVMGQVLNTIA